MSRPLVVGDPVRYFSLGSWRTGSVIALTVNSVVIKPKNGGVFTTHSPNDVWFDPSEGA